MLRAQTAASSLAAGLSVLSNFVAVALNPRDHHRSAEMAETEAAEEVEETPAEPARSRATGKHAPVAEPEPEIAAPEEPASEWAGETEPSAVAETRLRVEATPEIAAEDAVEAQPAAFDVANLSEELQDLHRRANRVAKVAMQDIKLLRPKDVRLGIEHKDLCHRLRSDIDKARKEYDRRFRAIQDHPVDYFHHWMVKILAEGDSEALGEYPYPSPVLRG